MKKIITAAALVAAGTMLADADTLMTTTLSGCNNTDISKVSLATDKDGVTGTLDSLVKDDGTSLSILVETGTGVEYAGTNSTFLSPDVNVGNGSGSWTATFSYDFGSETLSVSGIDLGTGIFSSSGQFQGSDMPGTRYFDLTVTLKDSQGTQLATQTISNREYVGVTDGNYIKTVSFGFGKDITLSDEVTLEVTAAQGSSNNNQGSFIGLSTVAFTGTAIPEPSAFGLIAGAGALALVAARRRRKA